MWREALVPVLITLVIGIPLTAVGFMLAKYFERLERHMRDLHDLRHKVGKWMIRTQIRLRKLERHCLGEVSPHDAKD